jgi:hypothetical protein
MERRMLFQNDNRVCQIVHQLQQILEDAYQSQVFIYLNDFCILTEPLFHLVENEKVCTHPEFIGAYQHFMDNKHGLLAFVN